MWELVVLIFQKGIFMKTVILSLVITAMLVSLFAWGQTHEMCATEAHKTAVEVQACATHWSLTK